MAATTDEYEDAILKISVQGPVKQVSAGSTAVEVSVPHAVLRLEEGYLYLESYPKDKNVWAGLIRGEAWVGDMIFSKKKQRNIILNIKK